MNKSQNHIVVGILAIALLVFYSTVITIGAIETSSLKETMQSNFLAEGARWDNEVGPEIIKNATEGAKPDLLKIKKDHLDKYSPINLKEVQGTADDFFPPGIIHIFSLVAGLVTAIVTTALAITPPSNSGGIGTFLAAKMFDANAPSPPPKTILGWKLPSRQKVVSWLINIYVLTWAVFGCICLLFCFALIRANEPQFSFLFEHGRIWIGLVVGAVASLVAVTPK